MPTGTAGFGTITVTAAGNLAQATELSEKPGFGRAFCLLKAASTCGSRENLCTAAADSIETSHSQEMPCKRFWPLKMGASFAARHLARQPSAWAKWSSTHR